jgi:ABC-2 type transport system ATP-binding protein
MTDEQQEGVGSTPPPETAVQLPGARTMIEAQGISKYYGPFVAVQNISFAIPEGQIAAFLGPNGAGKSTTMKILTGYLAASEGQARIAGIDVRTDRLQAARSLGYLPENGPLYAEMTPLELLRFFAEARELERTTLDQRIQEVADQCALELVLDKPIGKLSRGYRQRVGLAQALLHDPDVLILDEPTAGLDPNQIHEFRKHLQRLGREHKKTILLSTHILQEVEALADRILFVSGGRLVYDASLEEARHEEASLDALFQRLTRTASGERAASVGPTNGVEVSS